MISFSCYALNSKLSTCSLSVVLKNENFYNWLRVLLRCAVRQVLQSDGRAATRSIRVYASAYGSVLLHQKFSLIQIVSFFSYLS